MAITARILNDLITTGCHRLAHASQCSALGVQSNMRIASPGTIKEPAMFIVDVEGQLLTEWDFLGGRLLKLLMRDADS